MESDGTGLGRIVEEHVVVTGKEVGGDPTITGDDLPVAGQDGRAVLQRDAGQGFGRRGAADAEIILVAAQGADGVPFLRGDPAHTQAGQAVGLGEHAHGKGPFVDVAKGRGHGIRRFQAPVDLIGQDAQAVAAGQLADALPLVGGQGVAGGIVGRVQHQQTRLGRDEPLQLVKVAVPAVLALMQGPEGELAARGPRHLVQGLVGGELADHMLARLHQHVERPEDGLLRAHMQQHVFRTALRVQAGDRLPQGRSTVVLAVAQPGIQKAFLRARLQSQQLADAQGLAVRLRQQIRRAEFIPSKKDLQSEVPDFHVPSTGCLFGDTVAVPA